MWKRGEEAGRNGWRKVSGVMCVKSFSTNERKGKLMRPAVMFGLEAVVLRNRQEAELEIAEVKNDEDGQDQRDSTY